MKKRETAWTLALLIGLGAGCATSPRQSDQATRPIDVVAQTGDSFVRAARAAYDDLNDDFEQLVTDNARLDRERAAEDDDASVMPVPVDVTTEERRLAEAESQRRLAAPESSPQGTAPGLSRSAGDLPGGERAQPQKPFHPPRPAHAGANVGHGNPRVSADPEIGSHGAP